MSAELSPESSSIMTTPQSVATAGSARAFMHLSPSSNLVLSIEHLAARAGEGVCQMVELRRRENAPVDIRLFFKDRSWPASPQGRAFIEELASDPAVSDIRGKQGTITIRLSDEIVEAIGAELERGGDAGLRTDVILAGTSYMVGFAGPNTSKALHIGHLRNISIGNALAAALEAAGAESVRQSLVGDIGRNICEAMAGYTLFHDGEDPSVRGAKADRFIGECYARYIREHCAKPSHAGSGDPIVREVEIAGDTADAFMQGWLAGDPDTLMLWRRIREWVMNGHRETLDRFGVRIDRHDFESDAMVDLPELMEEGVRRGVLEREPDGTIIYRSGREEFETMILVRNDGFPTEHARLLGVYFRMLEERGANGYYIDLAGTEWQPASAIHMELMRKIRPERNNDNQIQLFHGMVTMQSSKMSSSDGDAVLIDDLLDRLAALPQIQEVAGLSRGTVDADTVSDIVVKSFFLCRPHMKVMEFSWDLLTQSDNPGWTIARAWSLASAPDDSTSEHNPDLYRLLVIRSQDYYRNLESAATEYNLSGLTSYLLHFCDDFLRAPNDPRSKRVARTVIERALKSLGLLAEQKKL